MKKKLDTMEIMNISRNFSLETLQKIIEGDFPEMVIEKIKFLDESWDNVVVEVNWEYIFRFPKDTDVPFFLELEVLKKLQGRITLEIPKIEFLGQSYSYSGYRKISGRHMSAEIYQSLSASEKEKLASDLAHFLREIHDSFPREVWKEMGVKEEDPHIYLSLAERLFSSKFDNQDVLDTTRQVIEKYRSMIQKPALDVFLYNDLHTENMAFDLSTKSLRGIYDFGDVALGDINRDFSHLYKFDPTVMREVMKKYETLTGRKLSEERAVLYAAMNEICDLAELMDQPESSVYKNAVERLTKWKGVLVT